MAPPRAVKLHVARPTDKHEELGPRERVDVTIEVESAKRRKDMEGKALRGGRRRRADAEGSPHSHEDPILPGAGGACSGAAGEDAPSQHGDRCQ